MDELDRIVKEKQPTGNKHAKINGNSFKAIQKASQVAPHDV